MELVTKQKVEALFSPALTGKITYTADEILLTLQTMPTVDAIPISWVRKYIEDHTQLMVDPKYDGWYFTEEPIDYYVKLRPYHVEEMLRAWERENEMR